MSQTKPASLTHDDVIVLLSVLDQVEGDNSYEYMAERLYPQLVRLDAEFRNESGVMQ